MLTLEQPRHPGRVNADVFIQFLGRLLKGARWPIFPILDGHPTHKAAKMRQLLDRAGGRLELFLLPPYSFELNLDEHVWNDLKNNGIGRMVITGPDQMKGEVLVHLRHLQQSPDLTRSFFQTPSTAYAA